MLPQAFGFAGTTAKFVSLLLLIFWFAGTSLNFCWNHILFLREPTHVFATTHSPQICYHDDFLLEPANHFATTVLGFVTIVCFVIFCYIHLHDIACFSSQFCYNHALILLETKTIFANIIFNFVGIEDNICYQAAMAFFLLQPSRIFATTGVAILLLPEPCSKHQEFLLPPPFIFVSIFAGTSLKIAPTVIRFCWNRHFLLRRWR